MVTKFSGKFAIIMLKKHKNLDATPTLKIVQIHMAHPVDRKRVDFTILDTNLTAQVVRNFVIEGVAC